ncbi:MAG TPA: FadD3 family acyl-CoA ligase [Myxococcota bacterium]|nr:FadD3 family acyl-CoA ligase [Myxococcota bacterium]
MTQPPRTIPRLTEAAATHHGDLVAVVDGKTTLTYTELLEAARAFGAALVASGVEPGNRVSIWTFNSVEWIVAVLGLWHAGAVLVPISTRFKGGEAADLLSRARVRVLVTSSDFLGNDYVAMLRATGAPLPDLEAIVVARGQAPEGTETWAAFLDRATEEARAEIERRVAAVRPDDPADILFTSGTTGVPKGVVHTHRSTLVVATDWPAMTGLAAGDKYLMVNPYSHMFGLKAGILACVSVGATMLPEPALDVDRALRRVADEKVTCFPSTPTLFRSILDHPQRDRYDLSSLKIASIGGADIPVELVRRMQGELPFRVLVSGYGLTEGGTAAATAPDDDPQTIATTVGRLRPTFELRLVDRNGHEVPRGQSGEIVLRSASIMREYLDDPAATAEALSPEGWLKTGDIGQQSEDGLLKIVGRIKDMFIVGGFNAYPAEIENALLRQPDVQQVAVIGVPDERLGEVGMAFIVRRPGSRASADDIIRWSREQMANYKVPRVVEFLDEFPLTSTGKVMKEALRERVTAKHRP